MAASCERLNEPSGSRQDIARWLSDRESQQEGLYSVELINNISFRDGRGIRFFTETCCSDDVELLVRMHLSPPYFHF